MACTLRDVAKRAGVSAMTASRVANGRHGVGADAQQRVEEAIKFLNYVPNRISRGLASQRTKTIGLIVPDVVNPFFAPLVRGAEIAARRLGYRVLLCNTENDLRLEREYIENLITHPVEGLLLAPVNDQSAHSIFALCRGGFPLVLLDRSLPETDCDSVVCDNVGGARRMTEHLIALGHRDIAHLSDVEETSTGRERLAGYKDALVAAGIPFREELVFRTTVDQMGGFRATQGVLALEKRPTVIFTINNMTAVGAMQELRERGLNVPLDIGLVCFDDVEHLAVLSPFLTVISQPAETIGSVGAQLLFERIAGKAGRRSRRITLQTDLLVRHSCNTRIGL
jgi:LacI family transcriptional regulator